MKTDKTIRRVTDFKAQRLETYRYWRSQSVEDRLSAVWETSEAAYAFAAAFKGSPVHDEHRADRAITRFERTRG